MIEKPFLFGERMCPSLDAKTLPSNPNFVNDFNMRMTILIFRTHVAYAHNLLYIVFNAGHFWACLVHIQNHRSV